MNATDISRAAGFKAVDNEGNELGIVSVQELKDAISTQVLETLSLRQQAATLEEPALLAADASARAANDTYENQLPEQTDLKWARALDASGNPILISKESLAAVVGGLIGITKETVIVSKNSNIDTGISCKGLVIARPSNSNTMTLFIVSTASNIMEEVKTIGDVIGVNSTLPLNITVENNTLHVSNSIDMDRYLYFTIIQ